MANLPWHKRCERERIYEARGMSFEQIGALNMIIDMIYDCGDKLRDDDRFISNLCGCDIRVWRRIKNDLIAMGKVTLDDGFLRHQDASNGVATRLATSVANGKVSRNYRAKLARVSSENNNIGETVDPETMSQSLKSRRKIDSESLQETLSLSYSEAKASVADAPISDQEKAKPKKASCPPTSPSPQANASASDDAAPAKKSMVERVTPETLDATFFRLGKEILGKNAGGRLVRLKDHVGGAARGLEILVRAAKAESPSEFIGGVMRNKTEFGNGKRGNRDDDRFNGNKVVQPKNQTPEQRAFDEKVKADFAMTDDERHEKHIRENPEAWAATERKYEAFMAQQEDKRKAKEQQNYGPPPVDAETNRRVQEELAEFRKRLREHNVHH